MKEAMTEPAPPSKAQPLFRIAIENNQGCRYSEDKQTIIELLDELGLLTQPEGVHKTAHGDADEVVYASDGKGKKDEKKEQAPGAPADFGNEEGPGKMPEPLPSCPVKTAFHGWSIS